MKKTYIGKRLEPHGCEVYVHYEDGSYCGYKGNREDQFADILGEKVHYQIAKLPKSHWEITSDFIDLWARREQEQ